MLQLYTRCFVECFFFWSEIYCFSTSGVQWLNIWCCNCSQGDKLQFKPGNSLSLSQLQPVGQTTQIFSTEGQRSWLFPSEGGEVWNWQVWRTVLPASLSAAKSSQVISFVKEPFSATNVAHRQAILERLMLWFSLPKRKVHTSWEVTLANSLIFSADVALAAGWAEELTYLYNKPC